MASGHIFGKILLCFLLPAILSLNISATGGPDESLPWLRYWVVLSIALILELLLERIEGIVFTIVKLVFVLWCLAPVEYNGSDVVFQYVLQPLHQCIYSIFTETSAFGLRAGISLLGNSYEVIKINIKYGYAIVIYFQKVVMDISMKGWIGTKTIVQETEEFAESCFFSSWDLGFTIINTLSKKMADLSLFLFDMIDEGLTCVVSAVKRCVIHYKNNQNNPRLFSDLFKKMTKNISTETSTRILFLTAMAQKVVDVIIKFAMNDLIKPLTSTLLNIVSEAFTTLMSFIEEITEILYQTILSSIHGTTTLFQRLAMDNPVYGFMGLKKVVELLEETREFVETCLVQFLDLVFTNINDCWDYFVLTSEQIAEFFILAFDMAQDVSLKCVNTLLTAIECCVLYYNNNNKNPRLFSDLFKQMVLEISTETSSIGLRFLNKTNETVEDCITFFMDNLHYFLEILLKITSETLTIGISYLALILELTQIWFQNLLPPINSAIAIAMEMPSYGGMLLQKIMEIIEDLPEIVTTYFYYCINLCTVLFDSGWGFASVIIERILDFLLIAYELMTNFAIIAFTTVFQWSTEGGKYIMPSIEGGLLYYKSNQKNPRLFSEVFKDLIYP